MASFWLEFEQAGDIKQANFESESVTIGRDRACDFVLDHPTVSRQHALIVHQGSGIFQLVVLSRGGLTAVDGQPAQAQEVPLFDGSMVTLGQYSLRFRCNQAQPRPGGPFPFGGYGAGAGGLGGTSGQPMAGPSGGPVLSAADNAANAATAQRAEDKKGAGIVTWDEIASSSAAMEEEEVGVVSDFERIQAAKKDEGSSPVLVIGGVLAIVGLLVVALLASAGGDNNRDIVDNSIPWEERTPVEISVSCLDGPECRRRAENSYDQAMALLERRDVETGNLFEAYKRLLELEAYLEKTGSGEVPERLRDWKEHHDKVRAELDTMFGRWRMEYHRASTLNRHEEMADILIAVNSYFPDRTAKEARWARDEEILMKNQGIYPIGRR